MSEQEVLIEVPGASTYTLIEPDKETLLDPSFEVPATPLGEASKMLVLLNRAKNEISKNLKEAQQNLVNLLKEDGVDTLTIQVGNQIYHLHLNEVEAQMKILIKEG